MVTKKRIEEIKKSGLGNPEKIRREIEETIEEGNRMSKENSEEFRRILC